MPNRREILIDAYNVMFAHPHLGPLLRRDLERARDEFLALVARLRPADATRVVVVFDAQRNPSPITAVGRTSESYRNSIHVVYARGSADAWIMRRIREDESPGALTIVTSDREILDAARAHGAGIRRVSEFLELPQKRRARLRRIRESEKPDRSSPGELAEWERLFGEPRDDD